MLIAVFWFFKKQIVLINENFGCNSGTSEKASLELWIVFLFKGATQIYFALSYLYKQTLQKKLYI